MKFSLTDQDIYTQVDLVTRSNVRAGDVDTCVKNDYDKAVACCAGIENKSEMKTTVNFLGDRVHYCTQLSDSGTWDAD